MPNVYLDGMTLNLTEEAFQNKELVRALEGGTLEEALQDPEFAAALDRLAEPKPEPASLKMHRRWRRGNVKRIKKYFEKAVGKKSYTMSNLEHAIVIAATAHKCQTDRAGAPYILHPIRVMLKLSSREDQIVAVLHDVVEDTRVSLGDLRREGFTSTIVDAVDSVTRRDGEPYDDFILRAAANPIGRKVKLADLEDNCDLSRIANPTEQDHKRIARYRRAIEMINKTDEEDVR